MGRDKGVSGTEKGVHKKKSAQYDRINTKQRQNSLFFGSGIQYNFNILESNFYKVLFLLKYKIQNISIFVYGMFIVILRTVFQLD